jgi:hypothetical protein
LFFLARYCESISRFLVELNRAQKILLL